MHRFFVTAEILAPQEIILPEEVVHHLVTVLRRPVGEEFLLLDGRGAICRCRLTAVSRRTATARVVARWQQPETAFPIRLLQALPKGDKMELVLQKGTELGITSFVPVLAGRSVTTPRGQGEARLRRWEKIVQEAARQCRRPVLPHLSPPLPLAAALDQCREPLRLVLWEEESRPLATLLPAQPPAAAAILVGPEGGFSAAEIAAARAAGFQSVAFGPRILRSETAGFSMASILQFLYGDLGALAALD
ncbi:MAG: 16S rRNA (uracil(1498)-N(3))-methyltransferase [Desulfuromonadales bacterium]|nr:16S rRNA (uracil(1498)-N(3))-methyltransferase [Desulfuromonadales bacterium]